MKAEGSWDQGRKTVIKNTLKKKHPTQLQNGAEGLAEKRDICEETEAMVSIRKGFCRVQVLDR